MDSMDPDKIDTDDFQLIMSLGSMEDAINFPKNDMHSERPGPFQGLLGMKELSKQVQLHIKWTVWIQIRLIVLGFSSHSPLDPWKMPKTVQK
jgi:hypothetical protein